MIQQEDIAGFFADEEDLHRDDYLFLTYRIETPYAPRLAAASLCCEMSTAQWKRPGLREDFRPKHAAQVVHLELLETSRRPFFDSPFTQGDQFYRCLVRIAYPHRNFGARIPNLLTVIAGEGAFFCQAITAIKLLDIEFPPAWLADFTGPRFGIEGLRSILNIYDRPIFFGVVKPNIGLTPAEFTELCVESWKGGLDIAKDDEMLCDTSWSPFEERCHLAGKAAQEASNTTGEKKLYLANITDEVDRMLELHDLAVKEGVGAVMINGLTTGLTAVHYLVKHAEVPVIGHFDFIAPFSRLPFFGVSTVVMTKLQRLSGFDAIIMPGFGPRMFTEEEEVLDNSDACVAPMGELKRSLPVPGGSDWAGTLPGAYERLRTVDFGFCPGRGVFGHPQGPRAGAASLRQAWEAIVAKVSLENFAEDHEELREALHFFGKRGRQAVSKQPPTPLSQFTSTLSK